MDCSGLGLGKMAGCLKHRIEGRNEGEFCYWLRKR